MFDCNLLIILVAMFNIVRLLGVHLTDPGAAWFATISGKPASVGFLCGKSATGCFAADDSVTFSSISGKPASVGFLYGKSANG